MSTAPFVDSRKDASGTATTYKTVELKDGNIWLQENFNYFVSDDVCQSFTGGGNVSAESRSDGFGLYYDWHAFKPDLGLIPAGWHLPTVQEWQALASCYGGMDNAYSALIEGGSSGLNLGFDGGTHFPGQGCEQLANNFGYFWSSSEGDDKEFAALLIIDKPKVKAEILYLRKTMRLSVRLVKDK